MAAFHGPAKVKLMVPDASLHLCSQDGFRKLTRTGVSSAVSCGGVELSSYL